MHVLPGQPEDDSKGALLVEEEVKVLWGKTEEGGWRQQVVANLNPP